MLPLISLSCFIFAIGATNQNVTNHNITDSRNYQKRRYYGGSTATNIAVMNSNNAALMNSNSCDGDDCDIECETTCIVCECAIACVACVISVISVISLFSVASVVSFLSFFSIVGISLICIAYFWSGCVLYKVFESRRARIHHI